VISLLSKTYMQSAASATGSNESSGARNSRERFSGEVETVFHKPVLLEETIAALSPNSGKQFLDGTLGAGGHSEALLSHGASVIGMDQDPQALAFATRRLACFGDKFTPIAGNFRNFAQTLRTLGMESLDGILLDLGVSSLHLDDASRGFSFLHDGPLDMRMNPTTGATARDILAEWPEEELRRIFREYGEEPQARKVARALVEVRQKQPLERTGELADLLERILGRKSGKHPGTKVFQALRIEVNDELGALEDAIAAAPDWLKPGGRIAIITFHSLEDRIVKNDFRDKSKAWLDDPSWPQPKPNPRFFYRAPLPKPLVAAEAELQENRRARSARLRVAERLSPSPRP
jgi:16S rRNA (cytosine1402-N4)-methyltransferase